MPENENQAPERRDVRTESRDSRDFDLRVQALDRSLGLPIIVPENPSDAQLLSIVEPVNSRSSVNGFTELMTANEIVYKRKAIQHAADLESDELRNQAFKSEEYIVANQLGTYFEGVEASVRYMSDSLRGHSSYSDIVAALPADAQTRIAGQRVQASLYISSLTRRLDERVAFANARKLQFSIAKNPDDETLKTQLTAVLQHPALSPESKSALEPGSKTAALWTAALDKNILRTLEGTQTVDGVDAGFLPQHIYIEILQARYTQLLEEQKRLVRGKAHQREGGQETLDLLSQEREGIMGELISYTNELGRYHLRLSQLFVTQNLFQDVDVAGAWMSPEGATPRLEKEKAAEGLASEKEFHLSALDGMVNTATNEFTPGLFETLRDGIANSTVTSTELALRIMSILKIADFGTGAISGRVKEYLAGPIAEAMGWPRDPETGNLKDPKDLTQAERDAMTAKVGQLRQVMITFQAQSGSSKIAETTQAIRALDATEGVGAFAIGNIKEPIPLESRPITAGDIPAKLAEYEKLLGSREDAVATLQAVLFQQLQAQWGALDDTGKAGTGFVGSYASMLSEFERIIGVQLDLSGAAFSISQRYFNVAKIVALGTAGIAISNLFAGGIVAKTAVRTAGRAVRAPVQMARRLILGRSPAQQIAMKEGPRATGVQRALWAGAVAYEAYNVYENVNEIQRDNERIRETKGQIEAELIKAGFTKVGTLDVYEHPLGPRVSLREINEGVDQQRAIQYARTGVAAAELGATLFMGARLLIGRAGLVFAAVAITVESGITSYQSQAARDFLSNPDTPPWLIAALGTQKLVKQSEYDMLVNSSSWNFIFTSSEQTKNEVRKRMYFSVFTQELGGFAPELLREIFAGRQNVGEMDAVYERDFQSLVMPYAMTRLFRMAQAKGSSATWEQVSEGKVDRGWVVFPPDLTHTEIRQALRESAVFYVQHLREKRYTEMLASEALLRKQLETDPNNTGLRTRLADAQALLRVLGDQEVLGSRVGSVLTVDNAGSLNGKTRAEVLLGLLNERSQKGNSLVLEDLDLPGIKGRADFDTTRAFLSQFVLDPVVRTNTERVQPLTTQDPEGRIYPAWNDWSGNFNRLFRLPTGLDEGHMNLMTNHAANNVWQGVDRSANFGDSMSDGEARNKITQGAIAYVDRHIASFGLRKNDALSESLYGGQIPVFGSLDGADQNQLLKSISTPNAGDPAFSLSNVRGVIVNGERIDANGHNVVLVTFIYGQPGSMYFLQNGAATSATSRSRGYSAGNSMAYDERTFRTTVLGKKFTTSIEPTLTQISLERKEAGRLQMIEYERERREAALRVAQRDAEKADVTLQRENLQSMTSLASPDKLMKIKDRWQQEAYRMLLTDPNSRVSNLATFTNYTDNPGPSVSAAPTDGRQQPDTQYIVKIEGPGGRTLKIDLAAYDNRDLPSVDRRLMQEFITTPIAGQSSDSLLKVLDLFPYDNFISSWRSNHYYKSELMRGLLPLYEETPDNDKAKLFLNELFQKLRIAGSITSTSKDEILAWFKEHKKMFGIA